MQNNIINISEVMSFCKDIEDVESEININLNKIEQLLDNMTLAFNEEKNKKMCEYIKKSKIFNLKKYCTKLSSFKLVLNKMSLAYVTMDNDFSTKTIIN